LGTRFWPAGVPQPAAFNVTGLPCVGASGVTIEAAYLWWSVSTNTNPATMNVTIQNPLGVTSVFVGNRIGTGSNTCWGYSATSSYRATIPPSFITGSGTYTISGLPTASSTGWMEDTDGATLMIIYSDPSQNYVGRLIIHDGALIELGNPSTHFTPIIPAVCSNSIFGMAFIMGSDFQLSGNTYSLNGGPYTSYLPDNTWWDFIEVSTSYFAGQTSSSFGINTAGDCYNWVAAGVYFRTNPGGSCLSCTTSPVCPLPTNTIDLKVDGISNKYVSLEWNSFEFGTAKSYTVERSIQNQEFSSLAVLEERPIMQFTDKSPSYNVPMHYRIRIQDKNGQTYYTETKTITLHNTSKVFASVYPNPTTLDKGLNLSYFTYQADRLNITVQDMMGRTIFSQTYETQAGDNSLKIQWSNIQTGNYILKVDNDRETQYFKVVITE
ncbi:MAG: T9SS type A sorting domain-containing protein, partial [Bacteroidia bacterium]|nr:T9SS type A sorting domain-containing protein [Bacteroidia bacterium]